ncbi:Putative peptidase C2, calpain, catalytic domain, papain-like cysteine peptidase superfamily [Colletotrichum destructivum]|uniref:Peptidase C2, calpain, catalytic domain, papain-like cysteine peptidase superfamily n=1 Tax=Colletotrichum destructivum TaxID=34406 RepID=A0AAX4J0U9_9PEZI|nr:Putative peptidase C2, calpain, catalytic domain, papain-like cysteine peptidase superfamily [Colletotrichum destructivum]
MFPIMSFGNSSDSDSDSSSSSAGRNITHPHHRKYIASMPVTVSKPRKTKQQPPQEIIDEFWAKFTTKTPGKATTVVPQNAYAERVAKRSATAIGIGTQVSYDEAATVCRAKVEKIVQECRRVNQRYRDPHYDIEFDLKFGRRDCLESLCNTRGEEPPQSTFHPKAVKRVVDIFDSPQFYIDGPTANDVRQGRDGDCWLMAALCNLSNKPGLIERVCVAHDQDVGVYGFVFHRDGEWYSEIIDDKLYLTKPDYDEGYLERILWEDRERVNSEEAYRRIYQTNSGALYFAQCENPNETWLPLLEKAYAKAHGDYASIEGGFTGEAIEDLTGGVTSEIYTTDILDREYFWNEKLLKVNQDWLLGCSTGFASRGWGERKGIIEMHAYSVMKAVEMDGHRLVLLKNPWGKGEWKGAWSDGSKEWTSEWLQKLQHTFGDDGAFWISYDDLLKKYNIFDATRLFGPDWEVTAIWTTLSVPWTLDYHDTYFAFTISKPGPVVLVLAQLDERYFRGLQGQYRFDLQLRLHKAGQEDYVVRSQASYRMNRSVNVELDLEAGSYEVLVKLDAVRNDQFLPIEQVIRNNAKGRREKLIRMGLAYDLAHSKGKVSESPKEKAVREAHEKKQREKKRAEIKRKILEKREQDHYLKTKAVKKRQKEDAKRKARQRARMEKLKASKGPCPLPPKQPDIHATTSGVSELSKPTSGRRTRIREVDCADLEFATSVLRVEEKAQSHGKPDGHAEVTVPREPHVLPRAQDGAKPPNSKQAGILALYSEEMSTELPNPTLDTRQSKVDARQVASVKSEDHEATPQASEAAISEATAPSEASEHLLCESDDDDFASVSSLSELSERELELHIDAVEAQERVPVGRMPPQPAAAASVDDQDEFERDPWNAVAVVGLRIYYKTSEDYQDEIIVKLRVVRPSPYDEAEEGPPEASDPGDNKSKGLDVDDSAKDATLEGEIQQRKKSIRPTSEDLGDASSSKACDDLVRRT